MNTTLYHGGPAGPALYHGGPAGKINLGCANRKMQSERGHLVPHNVWKRHAAVQTELACDPLRA